MTINGYTITLATAKSWLRQLASIAGIVVSIANTDHLPTTVRAIVLAGSIWIQRTQHWVDLLNDPTTPNPVTATSPSPAPTSPPTPPPQP